MSVDIEKLERPRERGGKTIARCPACAENGRDKSAEHLVIFPSGKWGCGANPEDKVHRQRIAELVCSTGAPVTRPTLDLSPPRRGHPELPALSTPSIKDVSAIQLQRGWPLFAGCELAIRAGHLFTGTMRDGDQDVRAWIITDSARRNAQARRLDGKLWIGINAKAKTVKGSEASWPIGSADIKRKPVVLLCEGGPDFLTAYFLAWWHGMQHDAAPVAMLGAGQRIHVEALPYFRGKRVLILPHSDPAGTKAETVWRNQLREAGACSVETYSVAPQKDVNDAVAACAREMGDDS